MLFTPEKWNSNKVKKYRHFARGLVHGFRQKIDVFLICVSFSKKRQKVKFFLYSGEKIELFGPQKWSSHEV